MIGSGTHIHTVVSIAQAQARDGDIPMAIRGFASLGSCGNHASKEERDLHTWLKNLRNIQLDAYITRIELEAWSRMSTDLSLPQPPNQHVSHLS